MIDPQGQANLWIKALEPRLHVVDMQTDNYMNIIENAVACGDPVLIQVRRLERTTTVPVGLLSSYRV